MYDEKDYIIFTENDPVSTDGKNRWQEGIDAWVKDHGTDKMKPPTDLSDNAADEVVVSIKNPNDKSTVSNAFDIQVKVTTGPDVKSVKLYKNGSEFKSYEGNSKDITEPVNFSDDVYELKVVATNSKDKRGDSTIKFGVNKPWDSPVSPTPAPTVAP